MHTELGDTVVVTGCVPLPCFPSRPLVLESEYCGSTGSIVELGCWDPRNALTLSTEKFTYPMWKASAMIPSGLPALQLVAMTVLETSLFLTKLFFHPPCGFLLPPSILPWTVIRKGGMKMAVSMLPSLYLSLRAESSRAERIRTPCHFQLSNCDHYC